MSATTQKPSNKTESIKFHLRVTQQVFKQETTYNTVTRYVKIHQLYEITCSFELSIYNLYK